MAQFIQFEFLRNYDLVGTVRDLSGTVVRAAVAADRLASTDDWVQPYRLQVTPELTGSYNLLVEADDVPVTQFVVNLTSTSGVFQPIPAGSQVYPGSAAVTKTPFTRLSIDHLFYGVTRVHWEFDQSFSDPGPYLMTLQASYAGHQNAADWEDVSETAVYPSVLEHIDSREQTGRQLLTHYRIKLQTALNVYVSAGEPVWGKLDKRDWLLAREITRKETIRLGRVSQPGYLLRRLRYGKLSPQAADTFTGSLFNTGLTPAWGTLFTGGYHPPIFVRIDGAIEGVSETRGDGSPNTQNQDMPTIQARVLAQPDVKCEDVWVNADTDERWIIRDIKNVASVRGVPIIRQLTLMKISHDNVIYKYPVSNFSYDSQITSDPSPANSTGCFVINHNYGGPDNLAYQSGDCCGIVGATVSVFTQEAIDAATPEEPAVPVATTVTVAGGQWQESVRLDAGEYVIKFEKPGFCGPDTATLTLVDPTPPANDTPATFVTSYGNF